MTQQVFLIVIVGAMVAFMFWQQRRQKKQQQEQDHMRSNFQKGDPVMTTSGMLVLVESVEGDSIVVRGEDGTLSRWMKAAITLRPGQTMGDLPSQANASETDEQPQIENTDQEDAEQSDNNDLYQSAESDLPEFPSSDSLAESEAPAPKKRGRPRKNSAQTTE
ncbi:MAG: preprotein translocase subunit YajC [Bifidobacteriaceae bacterium]|jgi:preprotein translocase subunit YajC|nr:preprotein translocase subunit YajC [Bifidobacteriaceae bacterium]